MTGELMKLHLQAAELQIAVDLHEKRAASEKHNAAVLRDLLSAALQRIAVLNKSVLPNLPLSDTQTIDYADRATPTGEPDKRDRDKWLAALLLIDDADLDAAKQLYVEHAPRALRGLLTGDGFTFDPQRQVYTRTATGRDVGSRDIKRLSILLALAVSHELEAEAGYVADGTSPIDLWENATANKAKDIAIAQAALGAGGIDKLTPALLATMIGTEGKPPGLAFSLSRLRNFAQEIATTSLQSVRGIVHRAGLYAAASNAAYEEVRRASHMAARDGKGRRLFLMERNILGSGEHCSDDDEGGTSGCPELSDRGWVEIGTLPPIGTRTCRMNCLCSLEYSLTGDLLQHPRA